MQSPINLISYCAGPHSISEANNFKDFHAHAFSSINVIDDCYEGKPLNSCKLKAAKFVLGRAQSGQHGTYILCDIDTRILRLRGLNDLIKDRDAAFFFRHASPLHLSILSGFIILNVNSNNEKIIQKFLL